MSEQTIRTAIVDEALTWLRTPYLLRGRVKGAGCDCGSFLMCVAVALGLMGDAELGVYHSDCWMNWTSEEYLKKVLAVTAKVLESISYRTGAGFPLAPGTLVLTRAAGSKYFNHGGIVVKWPQIIHAVVPCVELADATTHHLWTYKTIAAFDFKRVIDAP
jgi:cell wall-associated NlpC family hydrolase